jgi:DNA-binding MarR family transcriptional regulator
MVDALVRRQLIERKPDTEDRRQRTLALTGRGQALLGLVDRARAQEFLSIVRPLPTAERAVVAMGVAALSTHAMTRRGRLIKQRARR